MQGDKIEDLSVCVRASDVVDDVDGVGRVEHVAVVSNFLQHLRRRVAVNDYANNKNNVSYLKLYTFLNEKRGRSARDLFDCM